MDKSISLLRTCPLECLREVAMQVAAIGSDEAVSELIRMIEGSVHSRTNRSWRTLWRELPVMYQPADPEMALDVLVATNSKKALEYVKRLYSPEVSEHEEGRWTSQGIDTYYNAWLVEITEYPNAPMHWKDKLRLAVAVTWPEFTGSTGLRKSDHEIASQYQWQRSQQPLHAKLPAAIAALQASAR